MCWGQRRDSELPPCIFSPLLGHKSLPYEREQEAASDALKGKGGSKQSRWGAPCSTEMGNLY